MKHPKFDRREKFDRKRGRHKKRASVETRDWNAKYLPALPKLEIEPELEPKPVAQPKRPKPLPLPPPPPEWMDAETASKLYALRREVA